jgi:hypothetical protein
MGSWQARVNTPSTIVVPVPRLALTQQEACASFSCGEELFVEHIRPETPK